MTSPPKQIVVSGLSVDVEDYFQVQALAGSFPPSTWDRCPSRVVRNTEIILDLFAEAGVKGTFFTLGWIAERHPTLIRRITCDGHELASHGYCHQRVDRQTPDEFREDVRKTRRILEDVSGVPVIGYRAATFSLGPNTPWAWGVLEEEGHAYSSSVYPVVRDYYGYPDAPRFLYRPPGLRSLVEIPISTVHLGGRNLPCGGGGYFRLLPYVLSRWALKRVTEFAPAVFYIHPWEVDPDQPRATHAPLKSRLRHYLNLAQTASRLRRLTRDFHWDRFDRAFQIGLSGPLQSRTCAP
jgi:polysaccharide deacetylase family protein (PEP-CTERM system associated)